MEIRQLYRLQRKEMSSTPERRVRERIEELFPEYDTRFNTIKGLYNVHRPNELTLRDVTMEIVPYGLLEVYYPQAISYDVEPVFVSKGNTWLLFN